MRALAAPVRGVWLTRVAVGASLLLAIVACHDLAAQEVLRSSLSAPAPRVDERYRPAELKKLPLEQLVDLQITSASRRPEPLSQASSAIDALTGETIRRAGANNIPDALRLAAGMEVAQIDGHTWAISARGFNIATANKMQVLMDGRSLYTPLFSGVFWDVQRTFMPDLERIEVVRGPGATLWGANAVNGVINIRTKNARETQGFLLDASGGNEEGYAGIRYGGRAGNDTYYRLYVMHDRRGSLALERGGDAEDDTEFTQGGFRIDSNFTGDDTLTLQGDGYAGSFGQLNQPDIEADGGNLIARWTRQIDTDTSISLQGYYDRTHRLIPQVFEEHRDTFDVELEGRFVAGAHDLVYGANYRLSADEIGNIGPSLAFIPASETLHLVGVYVQDEWQLVPRKFALVAGSRLEHNSFSGFEVQPSVRFVWNPERSQTVWGAVSRAVRTPTRVDRDIFLPNPSTGAGIRLRGSRDFESERLVAYELGYRIQLADAASFDLASFYHDYDHLRSQEPGAAGDAARVLSNKLEGRSYGAALRARWQVTKWWEVDGNVTALNVKLRRGPGSADITNGRGEANDPDYFFSIHSGIDLPKNVEFDAVLRYADHLPHPQTPSYLTLDLRLGWAATENLSVAVVGRNLLDANHPEFRNNNPQLTREVERSVLATVQWRY
jgi:iron complex outermembrane recepter protein